MPRCTQPVPAAPRSTKLAAVIPLLALLGCAADQIPAAQQLSSQYKDQSIDQLVVARGPPTSTFAMTNGDKMHEWQLAAGTDGNGNAVQCKIRAVVNPQGTVRSITTNDQETGGTWCANALSGNLVNVANDDAAAATAVDAAVGTALLSALLW
jgi:hypothetical protein